MPPLPSYAFLTVGALVTITSLLLPNVRVFVIVGIIFLIIGAVKLNNEKKNSSKKTHMHQSYHTKSGHHVHHNPNIHYCHVCGTKSPKTARFCSGCGNLLR